MSTLAEQLLKAGLVSETQHNEVADKRDTREKEAAEAQVTAIERDQIEKLFTTLGRVTTVKRFRRVATSLLLLRPNLIDSVVQNAKELNGQDGLDALIEQVDHLYEWLPSLSEEEQESLIKETLK